MRFGTVQLTRCRYGWMLHHGPYIGKCFELYGQYSEAEVEVLRACIPPGSTAIDVGANIGDLTVPMSQIVGAQGRVFAIESHPDTFHVLSANLALNGLTNVKTLNHFVADTAQADTSGPWGRFGFVSAKWQPSFMTIDSLELDACAFIKIDVDGKECEVLRSARRTIEACRPFLYFENDMREKSEALLEHVLGLGYAIFFHPAPIFEADNFFGNPVNHWAPSTIMSLMMLAIPTERAAGLDLKWRRVTHSTDWWE